MKTLFVILLTVSLIALTWISLGWMALLVVPSMALFALMTFAPALVDWAQRDELRDSQAAIRKHAPGHVARLPLHSAGRSAAH